MSWILFVVYASVFLFLIYRLKFFRLEGLSRHAPPAFFLLKIFAGVALWGVYTFYYTDRSTSDMWKYFDDSQVMYDALHDHPSDYFRMLSGIGDNDPRIDMQYYHTMQHWYQQFDNNLLNDAHIVIRFNAAVRLVSMGNYHIHSLFMCFLAFIGLCCIYKVVYPFIREWKTTAAGIIFLLPSLLFWSSGVLKEGLMIFALGVLLLQFFRFIEDWKWWRVLLVFLSAWLLFITKFYVLAALIPSLLGAVWVTKRPGKALLKFVLVFVLFTIAGLNLQRIKPTYDVLKLLSYKQNDMLRLARGGVYVYNDTAFVFIEADQHDDLVKKNDSIYNIRDGSNYYYWYVQSDLKTDTFFVTNSHDRGNYKVFNDFPRAGSLMESKNLQPSLRCFAKETPRALFRALFRPLIWEGKNPMLLLPALENLLLLVLLLLIILFPRRPFSPGFAGFCIGFSLLLLLVMGLTTPVLGTLDRYRISALPFLITGLLLFVNYEKLTAKWPWITKLIPGK